jgi:hypothetical protein
LWPIAAKWGITLARCRGAMEVPYAQVRSHELDLKGNSGGIEPINYSTALLVRYQSQPLISWRTPYPAAIGPNTQASTA